MNVRERLRSMADIEYADFQHKLAPTVDREKCIGVRVPDTRKLAKEMYKSGEYRDFFNTLPHAYYDENMLHGCILSVLKDYSECVLCLEQFVPYIDNWAVCDSCIPSCIRRHEDEFIEKVLAWTKSKETYVCRFGINMLMRTYLEEHFKSEYCKIVCDIRSDEYYIKMMQAFYIATALAKQWDTAIKFVESKALDKWTHNKAIQKAKESFRITPEQKEYLNTLKM